MIACFNCTYRNHFHLGIIEKGLANGVIELEIGVVVAENDIVVVAVRRIALTIHQLDLLANST